MIAFSLSIFLSAFLLFIAQPLLAKKLLPWFGGGPAVWLSIVLFFQSILLLGYFYAYLLTKIKSLKKQVKVHLVLFIASLIFIPTLPVESKMLLEAWPPVGVFGILLVTLCLPGLIICASSPLLQYWYCQCYKTDYPYRYYALSNAGSLIGLVAFPFLFEPFLGLEFQLYGWSFLYIVYLIAASTCLYIVYQKGPFQTLATKHVSPSLKFSVVFSWIVLTFLSCALLLTTTQIMLQNVAGFPLLWVAPLSLYLISFILTFSYPAIYINYAWSALFIGICAIICLYFSHHMMTLTNQIVLYCGLLFSGCMICHGELYRLKPDASHLTTYYLFIALGGVLGGIFVNLVAPLIFNQWWDFYITIFGILLCIGIFVSLDRFSKPLRFALNSVFVLSVALLSFLFYAHYQKTNEDVVLKHRNFFGSFEVTERFANKEEFHYRTVTNGSIIHGKQFLFGQKRSNATTYYSPQSGIGLAINFEHTLRKMEPNPGLSIGVIGLGAGTIAALTQPRDRLRFYEIDPDIEKMARDYFYYLQDSRAKIEVIIGDGRIKLQEELASFGPLLFDVLAIDAFTGDSIPVHLLTREALDIYLSHLAPNGILAFHVSSRYVDLYPPLQTLASKLNLFLFTTQNDEDINNGVFSSKWILMSRKGEVGAYLYLHNSLLFPPDQMTPVWTDDFSCLLPIIRW